MNDSDRIDRLEKDNDKMWAKINSMDKKIEVTTYKVDQVLEVTKTIKEAVGELQQKPAKNWDKIITSIISNCIGGIIGVILGIIFASTQ